MRTTQRGFVIYDEFIDLYGAEVRVQESSLATEQALWIFVSPSADTSRPASAIHLSHDQAVRLAFTLLYAARAGLDEVLAEQERRDEDRRREEGP